MTTKTIKIAIMALSAALLIPGGLFAVDNTFAADDVKQKEVRELMSGIQKDVKVYVYDDSDKKNDPFTEKQKIVRDHNAELDEIIETLTTIVGHPVPDKKGVGALKEYIVDEQMKEEKRQRFYAELPEDAITETVIVGEDHLSVQGLYIIPSAYASHNPYPITSWKQVSVDVNGGSGTDDSGDSYNIDGGNQFSTLKTTISGTTVTYELTYADEDHPDPGWDDFYDQVRLTTYGRIADIETIAVINGVLDFNQGPQPIWSSGQSFADDFWGTHYSHTESYSSSKPLYISNSWNHAMATTNTNPSMSIITWTT